MARMTKKHKGIPRQLVYGLYLERHGPLRHIFFRPIWNHTTYHPQSLTSHSLLIVSCILPTTSVCVGEIPICGQEKLLCWTTLQPSLPFLPLPPFHPCSCSHDDSTRPHGKLVQAGEGEKPWKLSPQGANDRLLLSHPNGCCLVHKV